jgi:hypothetical protein
MLRVTIELVPWGIESRAKVIATGTIANTGTGTPTSGDYRIELRDAAGRKWKSGSVTGFPRKRLLAWHLLYRALEKLLGNRNSTPDSAPFPVLENRATNSNTRSQP